MPMSRHRLVCSLWVAFGGVVSACTPAHPEPARESATKPEVSGLAEVEPSEPAAPGPPPVVFEPPASRYEPVPLPEGSEPGEAWFLDDDRTVFRLRDGALQTVSVGKFRGRIFARDDEHVYLVGSRGVVQLGDAPRMIAPTTRPERLRDPKDAVVLAPDDIWVLGSTGLHHYDGTRWAFESTQSLLGEEKDVLDFVVAGDAGLFVASNIRVFRRTGTTWTTWEPGMKVTSDQGPFDYIRDFEAAPDGTPTMLLSGQLLSVTAKGVDPLRFKTLEETHGFHYLSFSDNGGVAVGDTDAFARVDTDAGTFAWWRDDVAPVLGMRATRELDLDDRGRLWAATFRGVTVLGPGDEVTELLRGSQPGFTEDLLDFVVTGAGPDIPRATSIGTGGVRGRLVHGEVPLANANFAICARPRPIIGDRDPAVDPCRGNALYYPSQTRDDGSFELHGLAAGSFRLVVEIDGSWKNTSSNAEVMVAPDRVRDEHDIVFKTRKPCGSCSSRSP